MSLAVFYPYPHVGLGSPAVLASALVLTVVTVAALRFRKTAPYLAFGWLWYLGTLVPVIGLIQVGEQAMADRYRYVPLIGIFVAIAWGLAELARRSRAARLLVSTGAACSIAGLCAATTLQPAASRKRSSTTNPRCACIRMTPMPTTISPSR